MVSGKARARSPAKRKVPPSRLRYEEANPIVSVRVSKELYAELKALRESSGLSLGDILRIGLKKTQPDLEAVREESFVEGYGIGYSAAKEEYEGTY